ncbi:hypothetical protein HED55_22490 [Ochrobactrum haematophilum]|uniref:ABC transmembrane type-1 domain-containing protein n=1 Tax=Brucella haematophila TaxID=419474 RepID=A0ABX1DPS7_9HYPH|nr:hypothetical protein [Brucella haematophila]
MAFAADCSCNSGFMPIGALLRLALEDGAAGLRTVMAEANTPKILWNTVVLAFGALVVAMVCGTAVALSVWALPPPSIRRYTSFLPVLPLLIPSVAHVIGFVFLFSPENGYINSVLRLLPFFSESYSGPLNIYTIWGIIFLHRLFAGVIRLPVRLHWSAGYGH